MITTVFELGGIMLINAAIALGVVSAVTGLVGFALAAFLVGCLLIGESLVLTWLARPKSVEVVDGDPAVS